MTCLNVWDTKYQRETRWNGDPQEAPDRCEVCDGTGLVLSIPACKGYLTYWDNKKNRPTERQYYYDKILVSTDHVDEEECPLCHGYGATY